MADWKEKERGRRSGLAETDQTVLVSALNNPGSGVALLQE